MLDFSPPESRTKGPTRPLDGGVGSKITKSGKREGNLTNLSRMPSFDHPKYGYTHGPIVSKEFVAYGENMCDASSFNSSWEPLLVRKREINLVKPTNKFKRYTYCGL